MLQIEKKAPRLEVTTIAIANLEGDNYIWSNGEKLTI